MLPSIDRRVSHSTTNKSADASSILLVFVLLLAVACWVRLFVHLLQPAQRHVRVDLRRVQFLVAEKRLKRS